MSGGQGSSPSPVVAETRTADETEALARRLGAAAAPGDLIGLVGDLGAGKTVFVRGLAAGLGIPPDEVVSPTFTMIAEYQGRMPLYHVDLYRLEPAAVDLLSLREYVYGRGVTVIEWFDRLPAGALDAALLVRIDYAQPGRRVTVEGQGSRAFALLAAFARGAHP